MDWHSIHVYYYEPDKRALILDGVRPLFRSLGDRVDAVSYTRHWRQGPHLRLNFRTTADTFASMVRPAADEIVGGFLARQPSAAHHLDRAREIQVHKRLAELEQDDGPLLPWHPDNSIVPARYDSRSAAVGGPHAAGLVADFQAASTDLAFRLTEAFRTPRQRLAGCFDLMIATGQAMSARGIVGGFVSFRSHAEGFLAGFPEATGLRPAWDRHYRAHRDALRQRMETVAAATRTGSGDVPFVRDWLAVLGPAREAAARGDLTLPIAGPDDAERLAGLSPFHHALLANPRWEERQRSAEFLRYRLMLNLTYLMLTRLGVNPVERYLLGHLAANTVEDAYGVAAIELVGGVR